MDNDDEFLLLCLTARDAGQAASDLVGVQDDILAMRFNLAVTMRLYKHDLEKDENNRKFWVSLVGGEPQDDGELEVA